EVFGTLIVQGTSTNRVTIRSAGETAGKGDWGVILFGYESLQTQPSRISYATFENFDSMVVRQPGATFTGCVFRKGFTSGMLVSTGSNDGSQPVVIDHCQFDDLGLYGIRIVGSSLILRNSLVQNCMGEGVAFLGQPPLEDATSRLQNNILRNCSVTGLLLQDFMSPQVVNNVFFSMGYGGILCRNNSHPLLLNNIIAKCGRPGIMAQTSSFPTIDYNDVWQNNTLGDSTTNYEGIALPPDHHNLSSDPLFVSGSLAVLQDGSPCIDRGHPGTEYNDTDGTRNDIGAYGGPNGGGIGPSVAWESAGKSVRR
ncbi:MAG: right-handed parallel beta-helix repeat-containing protein, partial [Calditrichaeota bacterium]|nr:right-handed parallel beta-helix repeat-containing protein [Calditrichota bacterium]